ncbi:YqxA family protein [Anoxybacillus rupiensis]|jgi:Protein of unknown function (DUF3679)|uniref:YqxA family protein n=1 Tax=Anoxybacteroides rupiense TaxID=311460 RepID=A0ABD5ITX2_9BACL|nr:MULTISPECIES: YqxA family protein [Anoxybacillus]KXG11340.1 hypothetical protein AT864_00423 [Anoxybacillus sp. P3H1B]MBB3906918.1 hypothetical protein [Anoxybacillus rupiensis]MBS2769972.1 YqxA family protein [Anoxybacillus rupiensis]MDE8562656.1 YqxA family protein [Anoxybacillus rupiensis]MED5050901.1 YqxA family protein [Anoxybacillus rupiensis]
MAKFTLQFLTAVILLFFGVLLGMQQANQGMIKMKGYNDPSFQTVFHVAKDKNGEMEAMVMGNRVSIENISEKKEKLEQMKMFNLFSELGKHLAEGVRSVIQSLLSFVGQLIE